MRRRRKRRPAFRAPELTVAQILAWADEFHERTGRWPRRDHSKIPGSIGETWRKVDAALRYGLRGLPAGSARPFAALAAHFFFQVGYSPGKSGQPSVFPTNLPPCCVSIMPSRGEFSIGLLPEFLQFLLESFLEHLCGSDKGLQRHFLI